MFKLHQQNTDFAWTQPDGPYATISLAQAEAYRETGGFVFHDAFTNQEIAALMAELDPIESSANRTLQDQPPLGPSIARADEIVFTPHIVEHSSVAGAFARHPVLQGICRDLIGDEVHLYWDQLVYKRPDTAVNFPWHQDNGYTFVQPQQYLTCWIALTDATVKNGCPWMAPGLHRLGTLEHRWTDLGFVCLESDPHDAVALELKAGSIAVFSSLTPHRTGPNQTDEIRKAYILQFAPAGAQVYPRSGEPYPANDPNRQFRVV